MKKYLFIFCFFTTQHAWADIYQCREKGSITFVDASTKENFNHCVLITEHKASPYEASTRGNDTIKKSPPNQTAETVRIDPQTQETRDIKRKQILLAELKTEEEALKAAKNSGASSDERLHQSNIDLINKEIQRLESQHLETKRLK